MRINTVVSIDEVISKDEGRYQARIKLIEMDNWLSERFDELFDEEEKACLRMPWILMLEYTQRAIRSKVGYLFCKYNIRLMEERPILVEDEGKYKVRVMYVFEYNR